MSISQLNSLDSIERRRTELRSELSRRETARREARRQALRAEWNRRQAEQGRDRLAPFIRAGWEVVEPGRPIVWGRHLDAMCEHLEALVAGKIQNLVITIPPGCTKSRTVGVFLPAWVWLKWSECRWLFFSNEDSLATRESTACRRLIESEWYTTHYPGACRIVTDQNTKTWYENDRAGHRQCFGVGANATGKKGDFIVVDDANDAEKVQSAVNRKSVNDKWDNSIYDRVIDFKTGRRLIIGQRTHTEDLIGHVLAGGEFEELRIPEEFKPARRYVTSIGWTDWRTAEGELLRPDQFGPEQREAAVKRLGRLGFDCKHNQEPRNPEGARFKRHWFPRYTMQGDYLVLQRPGEAEAYRVRWQECQVFGTADPAASAKETADYTVFGAWLVTPRADVVWWDAERFQAELPDQIPRLKAFYQRNRLGWVGIEAVASNNGLFTMMRREPVVVKKLDPLGVDKLVRSTPAQILAESGRLWLPERGVRPGFPLDDVEAELYAYTGDEKVDVNDDVIDCLSYAVKLFVSGPSVNDRNAVPKVW